MVHSLNGFYLARCDLRETRESVFRITRDSATSTGHIATLAPRCLAGLISVLWNASEWIRSRYRLRSPDYMETAVLELAYLGETYVNLPNGTAVILRDDRVEKFYFKDCSFFGELYRTLQPLQVVEVLRSGPDLVVVAQPRYEPVKRSLSDLETLISVREALGRLHGVDVTGASIGGHFAVTCKLEQLLQFFSGADASTCSAGEGYLEVGRKLESASTRYRRVLCHGDLWTGNIRATRAGPSVLIDYDKALFFCEAYDYIHFFLMSRVLSVNKSLRRLAANVGEHATNALEYLSRECAGRCGVFEIGEIALCIRLFALLKLLQQDLRSGVAGRSVEALRDSLS